MGEREQGTLFEPKFNRAVRVEPATIELTEDTGALALRTAAEQVGLVGALARLRDPRRPDLLTHPMVELVLTRVFLIAQGWGDQDDADALRTDVAFRMAVSERRGTRPLDPPRTLEPTGLASQPTMSRMVDTLTYEPNLALLPKVLLQVGMSRLADERLDRELTLDVDSFPQVAHGHQEGAVYNGHYHETMLHPLAILAHTGDLLAVQQRPGNVHTAHEVRDLLAPVLQAVKPMVDSVWVRVDAGFASGSFFDWLDEREVQWVTRLRTNAALTRHCQGWAARVRAWWRKHADHDEPRTELYEFEYQAESWSRPRRVVAVMVERDSHEGELFDRLFFLCTSADAERADAAEILGRYRQRGRAEAHIGEFVRETRPSLSSTGLAHNQVNTLLAALAYQLLHHIRQRLVDVTGEGLSLRRLRERVLKVATQVVRHARRVVFRIGHVKVEAWKLLSRALEPPVPALQEGLPAN